MRHLCQGSRRSGQHHVLVAEVDAGGLPDLGQDGAEHDGVERAVRRTPLQVEAELGRNRDLAEHHRGVALLLVPLAVTVPVRLAIGETKLHGLDARDGGGGRQQVVDHRVSVVDVAIDVDLELDLAERVVVFGLCTAVHDYLPTHLWLRGAVRTMRMCVSLHTR